MVGSKRRVGLSLAVGGLISLVLASQVFAAQSWGVRIPISSDALPDGLVALDATTLVTAYDYYDGAKYDIRVSRSTDSGATWSPPKTLAATSGAAIAGLGQNVDVAWSKGGRIWYARSLDAGLTYKTPVALSPTGKNGNVALARGPGGLVAIAWSIFQKTAAKVRVSTDGGVTFGPTTSFNTNENDFEPVLAAGDGVVYLGYRTQLNTLVVSRSTDGGQSWSAAQTMTTNAVGMSFQFYLVASGAQAYAAYVDRNSQTGFGTIKYRRTTNSGATWSAVHVLTPSNWHVEYPRLDLHDGVLRAVYSRMSDASYNGYYVQSKDGVNWSKAAQIDSSVFGPYVAFASQTVVTYRSLRDNEVFVRTRS